MSDRRAQIEARLAAGIGWCDREGPWRVTADPLGLHVEHGCGRGRVVLDVASDHPDAPRRAVADLIAHAPDDLRWLLDALAEAEAERDEERRYLDVMRRKWGQRSNELGDLRQRLAAAEAERDALAARLAAVEGLVALETDAPGSVDGLLSSLREALECDR